MQSDFLREMALIFAMQIVSPKISYIFLYEICTKFVSFVRNLYKTCTKLCLLVWATLTQTPQKPKYKPIMYEILSPIPIFGYKKAPKILYPNPWVFLKRFPPKPKNLMGIFILFHLFIIFNALLLNRLQLILSYIHILYI